LQSQLLQAVGQTFALTSVVWFNLNHLQLKEVLTFGALLQTARLFGGELGSGFIQTFLRVREQMYSNLVGLHVIVGSHATEQRLEYYANVVGSHSNGTAQARARATALLAHTVQNQASVLSYIDGFMLLGFAALGALLLMVALKDPPPKPVALGSTGVAQG
jgi:DHA2 family multidrug resistance protein